VADAPVDALLVRAEDLAKGWLLALIEQVALDEMPSILAADLARDGPRLCDALVRALADDTDLRRLQLGGALEPLAATVGELTGANGLEATERAIDALSAVLWSAIRAELGDPSPDQIAELAERLMRVMEEVRAAAWRRVDSRREGGAAAPPYSPPLAPAPAPAAARPSVPTRPSVPIRSPALTPPSVPTRAPGPPPPAAQPRAPAPTGPPAAAAAPPAVGPPPSVGPPPAPAAARPATAAPSPAGGPLWLGALEDEVDRSRRTGSPLSLLLAELDDAERMMQIEDQSAADSIFGSFAQSVRSAVRRQDTLACETDTRAWIIARDTGRVGAHALALRIAAALQETPTWRGAPLAVSVGIAVLGQDGRDSTDLVEAAEEARFSAQASGITVARIEAPSVPDGGSGPAPEDAAG
jgi:GGDEF domain-containing protein